MKGRTRFPGVLTVVLSVSIVVLLWLARVSQKQSDAGGHLHSQNTASVWHAATLKLGDVPMSVPDPVSHYAQKEGDFCNKCDFDLYKVLLPILPCCNDSSAAVLTGGVNRGALVDLVLQYCKGPQVHGFEIQTELFEELQLKYSKAHSSRVVLNNNGLSDAQHTLPVASGGEGAGLYTHFRGKNVWLNNTVVETVSLGQYVEHHGLHGRVCIAIIDVEGHEAKVIQGMQLMQGSLNFPVFAYELGGTWVDSRNPSTWSQAATAEFLINLGYRLYLIGQRNLMEVDAEFFSKSRVHNEGFGYFVQGNLLAVHKSVLA